MDGDAIASYKILLDTLRKLTLLGGTVDKGTYPNKYDAGKESLNLHYNMHETSRPILKTINCPLSKLIEFLEGLS